MCASSHSPAQQAWVHGPWDAGSYHLSHGSGQYLKSAPYWYESAWAAVWAAAPYFLLVTVILSTRGASLQTVEG